MGLIKLILADGETPPGGCGIFEFPRGAGGGVCGGGSKVIYLSPLGGFGASLPPGGFRACLFPWGVFGVAMGFWFGRYFYEVLTLFGLLYFY